MSDVTDLGRERRFRTTDNRDWSAGDCLRAALDMAEDDPPTAVLAILIYDDEEGYDVSIVAQNLSEAQKVGALEVTKFDILEAARG